jgi:cyclic pyranopterin phosphate synthase
VIRLGITDACGRDIHYMRVSVTDRCNFRCMYCMPPEGVRWLPPGSILTYEEIERVVRVAVQLGVSKVRLTGGEPLVRKGIVTFVRTLAAIPGITDLAMTTNASLLGQYAKDLKEAGLTRINISLDTLRTERFQAMTGRNHLRRVLHNIEAAEKIGFAPLKINVVVMKHVNEDELVDFARLTLEKPYQIRFIEYMPFKGSAEDGNRLVTVTRMKEILAAGGYKTLLPEPRGTGPAMVYRLPSGIGTVGFITPVTNHFCQSCNRIRLTADGRIKPCLLSDTEVDIKSALRSGATDRELQQMLQQTVWQKPRRHHLDANPVLARGMSKIGG